jgi:hypothetical protein
MYPPAVPVFQRLIPLVLCTTVGLASPIAVAAPTEESNKVALERSSKVDLGRQWAKYQRSKDARPFVDFVQADLRRKRNVGMGTTMIGAGVLLAGVMMLSLTAPRNDREGAVIGSYAIIGAGGVSMIVGGIVWWANGRKLERIEDAGLAFGRGRVRLTAAGPIGVNRGGGFGIGLAF